MFTYAEGVVVVRHGVTVANRRRETRRAVRRAVRRATEDVDALGRRHLRARPGPLFPVDAEPDERADLGAELDGFLLRQVAEVLDFEFPVPVPPPCGREATLLLLMYHGWSAGRAAHLAGRSLVAATSVQEPIESSGLDNWAGSRGFRRRTGPTAPPPACTGIHPALVTTGPDVYGQDWVGGWPWFSIFCCLARR
jgi:hypothetical protein